MEALVVLAQTQDPVPVISQTVQLDVRLLSLLGGLVVPLLTAVATKRLAHPALKSLVTLVLSVIAGAVAVATQANGVVVTDQWVDGIVTTFISAIASYYGFWKPSTIAPRLQQATANVGLGSNNPDSVVSAWEGSVNNPASTQVSPTPEPSEPQKQPEVTNEAATEVRSMARDVDYEPRHYRKD